MIHYCHADSFTTFCGIMFDLLLEIGMHFSNPLIRIFIESNFTTWNTELGDAIEADTRFDNVEVPKLNKSKSGKWKHGFNKNHRVAIQYVIDMWKLLEIDGVRFADKLVKLDNRHTDEYLIDELLTDMKEFLWQEEDKSEIPSDIFKRKTPKSPTESKRSEGVSHGDLYQAFSACVTFSKIVKNNEKKY